MTFEEDERRQQHAGRAEATLHRAVPDERLLQRMEPALGLEPAHGDERPAAHGAREDEAARHRPAVEQHRAGAAHALAAAFLRVEDAERVAQHGEQRLLGARLHLAGPSVDEELHHDALTARAAARTSARRASTPAR